MGIKNKTKFKIDKSKCVKCNNCINTCSGMVLSRGSDGYPVMSDFERYGWKGCWRCQHCLAACPKAAISIFDKKPEDSLLLPPKKMGEYMQQLVVNRRSCRRFLDENVDPRIIDKILEAMMAAPTGGNSCNVEYTIIDDKERVKQIWKIAYSKMEEAANNRLYTSNFSDFYYKKMKQSEKTVRKDDLLFCNAPHLFIAHEKCVSKWAEDSKVNCNIATTYFELLAASFGLGAIIMSYPADVLAELAPEAEKLIGIPSDHYRKLIVGFGYPEIQYYRGVQKKKVGKIHRFTQKK